MFKKIKGNIFNSSAQVLVNTVNCVGVMGRGIALECKLRFPEMYMSYKEFCDQKKIQKGLDKFIKTYSEKGITSIAFPLLGASLGGLPEEKVFKLMENKLSRLQNIDIEVYEFDPNAKDDLFLKFYQKKDYHF